MATLLLPSWAHAQAGNYPITAQQRAAAKAVAEQLLNDSVIEGEHPLPPIAQAKPDQVWNVHEGVLCEAVCSAPGVYHGYPWCGRPGRNRLARPVKRALLEKARQQGCAAAVEDWFKKYES